MDETITAWLAADHTHELQVQMWSNGLFAARACEWGMFAGSVMAEAVERTPERALARLAEQLKERGLVQ